MANKLSSILHDYINQGRMGRTDSLESEGVKLTDEQLCELWRMASDLESSRSSLHEAIKKIARKKY